MYVRLDVELALCVQGNPVVPLTAECRYRKLLLQTSRAARR